LDLSVVPPAAAPELDAEQRQVVEHREGPLLVLAGPGTGKTTTIVESVVSRLDEGQNAESILVLTFSRRAAAELRDRIAVRRSGGLLPQVATFHSFAYGLIRSTSEDYLDPPRLLSGAEEDQRIRDLIAGSVADGSVRWPPDLAEALGTHGLAVEVRTLIARMRERDITPQQLRELAAEHDRPAWSAVADVAEQEEGVMVLQNVMDYAELMRRAVLRAGDPDVAVDLHRRITAIYVDEFQDTDPLQVEFLRRIAGPQTSVVAVGDPDQAIYAFRGADVTGILEFPRRFSQRNGEPAPVIALRTVRRYGADIAAAARAVLAPAALPGLPAQAQRLHRSPLLDESRQSIQKAVHVRSCDSRTARDAYVAEQIRAAHVYEKVPWRDMAVLVRSARDLAGIERALRLAGVPAAITADEIPLRAEPAVAYLLAVVELAALPAGTSADKVRPEVALDVLTGPIGRLDVAELRALARALRAARKDAGLTPMAGRDLIRDVVMGLEPMPGGIDPTSNIATGVRRVRDVIDSVHAHIRAGAPVAEVLWTAWTGGSTPHTWPERLRLAAIDGSSMANHDLDAVIALFDTAERISERYRGVYGVSAFIAMLRDQAIPAESIAGEGTHHDRVQVMTVHRAKGLEWSHVWVVGLEEGNWPNLSLRGSLLGVQELDEILRSQARDPVADLMREERNLLYVACTRARRQLSLVTIDAQEAGDDRASRFIDDLARAGFTARGVDDQPPVIARWPVLVAELRTALMDQSAPDEVRAQAATLLAAIAAIRDSSGERVAPAADPDTWWGTRDLSDGPVPLRDADVEVVLSGSSLDALRECSMKWFLDHEVHAESIRGSSTAFGSIVHAIADHVAKGDIPEDIEAMDAFVDHVWAAVDFDARWRSSAERVEARQALQRFLTYHRANLRALVDTERYLETTLEVPTSSGDSEHVRIRGFLDRIERDDHDRLVAIDLKTSATIPTKAETANHGQLGVYQLLLGGSADEQAEVGGAALIQLRKDAGASDPGPKEQFQEPVTHTAVQGVSWIERALGEAVEIIRSERIVASVGKQCNHCAFTSLCPEKNPQTSVVVMVNPTIPGDDS